MAIKILPKAELYRQMDRFQSDANSPISWKFFGELCGYEADYLRKIFIYKTEPITEGVQIRVSKALEQIKNGDITIMRNKDQTRFMQFNSKPKPRVARGYKIKLQDGQLKVQAGIVNKNDYSQPTLLEELED